MNNNDVNFYPSALTIAGSDSGGGAGIQADLRTFNAFGVFGCSAITAVTAQNPFKVSRIDAIPAAGVTAQIEAVLAAIDVKFAKTGMLMNSEIIFAVASAIKKHKLQLIVDPVMVSTSGTKLLEDSAIAAMQQELLPLADWLTPNIPEAELLLGRKLTLHTDLPAAAEQLSERFKCSCLLKAGHILEEADCAADIVYHDGKCYELISPLADVLPIATHGTGCTLSSALTAAFALGFSWKQVLRMAKGFVLGSLVDTVPLGDKLEAMYPPTESFEEKTQLRRI
ncbi:MAG: bifunctional hydroxymethylpyrimidine kinase/phosphomethylpyrimidine kinase [Victivallaceae bacterium]